MLELECSGTSYEIGFQHGQQANREIERSVAFYEKLFLKSTGLAWDQVCSEASRFVPLLERDYSGFNNEIRGISAGAGISFASILALNVRTEINYGMFSDGCTALSWKNGNASFLAQNWDWEEEQKENLVHIRIQQVSKPSIDMVTEAGIIGKIGMNSGGVGVCLNAIRAKGVEFGKLPCHLALRKCLDSRSKDEAAAVLQKAGVASACHILVADTMGGVGLECSHLQITELPMSEGGTVTHTNHFVANHPGVQEKLQFKDTFARLERINHLIHTVSPSAETVSSLLRDEDGFPTAICRQRTDDSTVATLFSIVMDLGQLRAIVKIGRPIEDGELIHLNPN